MRVKTGLVRKGMLTAAVIAGAIAFGASPAQAIPTIPPPSPALLTIVNYYSGTTLVGQRWFGCPGTGPQSWGIQTHYATLTSAPCG